MADREKLKIVTKKHLARVEREQIQRRYILIISIVIVALVIILIGVGIIIEGFIKPAKPIGQVNGTEISTRDFQSFVRYQRFRLVNEYLSNFQFIQSMGDPESFSYFEPYLRQIQDQLQPEALGLSSIDQMVENVIVQDEAARRGIQVSNDEVEKRMQEVLFQYFPDGTPTPIPTGLIPSTPTLSSIQMTLVPPSPTAVITDSAENSVAPTEIVNEEILEPTPTLIPPTPTVYTEENFKKDYDEYMGYINSFAKIKTSAIISFYETVLLRERLAQVVVTDIPAEEEVLWAHHILFRDDENGQNEALNFISRIESGGNFISAAEELSSMGTDEESNIVFEDLGWFGSGQMVAEFEESAKSLKIGEISQPVHTSFGWHVIQLLGRDIQPLGYEDMERMRFESFQAWLDIMREEAEININPDWISSVPTEPDIPEQAKLPPQ